MDATPATAGPQEAQKAASMLRPRGPDSLEGQVILVTGAGRGLGEITSLVLDAAGAVVIAADLCEDSAHTTAARLQHQEGARQALALDVGDEHQTADAVARIVAEFGRLDVLVNNAAIDVTLPIDELSVEDWDRIVRTNLRGPFLLSKEAFAVMREQGGGQIVNICSTAAKRAWPNASAYHATKWGLLGLSHALHAEGRHHQIKVTAIVCGGMRTPFLLDRFPEIDPENLQDPTNVAQAIRFVLSQPAETVIPELMVLPMRETSWP